MYTSSRSSVISPTAQQSNAPPCHLALLQRHCKGSTAPLLSSEATDRASRAILYVTLVGIYKIIKMAVLFYAHTSAVCVSLGAPNHLG